MAKKNKYLQGASGAELKAPPKTTPAKKPGFFARISKYLRDSRAEFKKIVWPTKKQIINNTLVVLVMVAAVAVIVWSLDWVLAFLRDLLINAF